MPKARADLSAGRPAELDFASLGVERSVTMEPGSGGIRLVCRSRTVWQPTCEERAQFPEVIALLDDLLRQTLDSLAAAGVDPAPLVVWALTAG